MNPPIELPNTDTDAVGVISELYRRAAEELLHAYQRNKEATRHHERGAFRAALHHARQSCRHSCTAHEHLSSALEHSQRLAMDPSVADGSSVLPFTHRHEH